MKKILLIALLSLFFASNGLCVMITQAPYFDTDVGEIDIYIAEGSKVGSPEAEMNWANQYIEPDVNWYFDDDQPVTYYATDAPGVYAFMLDNSFPDPGYYIIKNTNYMALFQNVANLAWGVFRVGDIHEDMNLGNGEFTISHVTPLGANPVPEPATMLLLGTGLLSIAGLHRKLKK